MQDKQTKMHSFSWLNGLKSSRLLFVVVVDHRVFAVFATGCETNTEVNKWSKRIQN